MENARTQMERLQAIPGAALWTLVSVQALHRFYRGRSEEVVASWMTSEDRDAAIADNIEYVDAALDAVPHGPATRIVYAGFSQGVAMAFRSAVRGRHGAAGVIGIGGDVPPELLADAERDVPVRAARPRRARRMADGAEVQSRPERPRGADARRRGSARSNTTAAMNGAGPWPKA